MKNKRIIELESAVQECTKKIEILTRRIVIAQRLENELEGLVEDRRSELVKQLINRNDEETRGRVKELDRLMFLPETLSTELRSWQSSLSDNQKELKGLESDGGEE
jgi:hypothetical protein